MHYNMFNKPWKYDGVPYGELFWRYAKGTHFYTQLLEAKNSYTDEEKALLTHAIQRFMGNA